MNPDFPIPDRLKAAAPGLGEASGTTVECRAMELARIDGRTSYNDADLTRAAAELAGSTSRSLPPEVVVPGLNELTAWDDPIGQDGHRAARIPLEDENSIAERLIQDGIDEADHDHRVSAADEGI